MKIAEKNLDERIQFRINSEDKNKLANMFQFSEFFQMICSFYTLYDYLQSIDLNVIDSIRSLLTDFEKGVHEAYKEMQQKNKKSVSFSIEIKITE